MARRIKIRLATVSLTLGALLALGACVPQVDKSGPPNAQGWTPGNQAFWRETSQGSRLVPKAWYDALEQADSTSPFSDQAYLATFGYLPSAPGRLSQRGVNLPIGFTVDKQSDQDLKHTGLAWYGGQKHDAGNAEPWVGMNCAACHSSNITYQGENFMVDGAPTVADFQSFIAALDKALRQTLGDDDRFGRFAAKVLSGKDSEPNRTLLKQQLGVLVAWQERVAKMNGDPFTRASGEQKGFVQPYGYGRLDAVGHILNKVALYNEAVPQSGNLSDAPVSYPFLWDISKHERVQWNGSASNAKLKLAKTRDIDYGALGRNTGEVIGVFGEVITTKPGLVNVLKGFKSSVDTNGLVSLEELLSELKPPPWPGKFGALDTALVAKGDAIFDRLNCGACHNDAKTWKPGQPFEHMTTLKEMSADNRANLTDIWMACNAATRLANTGNLQGAKSGVTGGPKFGATEPAFNQLAYTVKLTLIGKKGTIIERIGKIFFNVEPPRTILGAAQDPDDIRQAQAEQCITGNGFPPETQKILAYKARPLDGIWATAPYLHNGSVPTLYHLLLAPKDRPTSFFSGAHEYDPKFGGYVWKDPPAGRFSKFSTTDASGKPIIGNSNAGHDYGVGTLSEPDRLALLEYLKSL